jgi:hypothetical protein
MSNTSQGPGWWQASDGNWYPPEREPGHAATSTASESPAQVVPVVSAIQATPGGTLAGDAEYNQLHTIRYRGGWIGLFAGENQTKALQRAIPQLNASARRVVAVVPDRWSFWKRLGVILLLIVTLGIVGRVPNVLLISEPNP